MTFILLALLTHQTPAQIPPKLFPKVIYGKDDRLDVFESSDNLMKEATLSTAALIRNHNLIEHNGIYTLQAPTLAKTGICSSERFANQLTAAACSGFLVAPDKIVTAGHCVSSEIECLGHFWIFDYSNTESVKKSFSFNQEQIYKCTKIIEHKKDNETKADYAVIKLDRPVIGRNPLPFRKHGRPANDATFTVIGHPSGLPTKIASSAQMRSNTDPIFFTINSDTYSVNSGSAVIDSKTGIVEGILVRGDVDYLPTKEGCSVSVNHTENGGTGEGVTRITVIENLSK